MPVFNLSFGLKPVNAKDKKPSNRYVIIESKCEGIIVIDKEGNYKVKYKDKLYSLTGESYRAKGKKVIYARRLDQYGHRIKIIRDVDNRKNIDSRFYIPFAVGLVAKGKLVQIIFGTVLFHIVSCYNPGDSMETVFAFKEWKQYEDKINNKEIDINNEL